MAIPIKLSYTEMGEGLPVVLLHGYPFSSDTWHEQRKALSADFRVITPDLRGFGASMAPDGVYDMELLAQDVFTLLDSLNIDKVAMLGHSMGGYVTLAAWKLYPQRVSVMGLIASQPGADSDEVRQNRLTMADKVIDAGSKGPLLVAESMMPKLFAGGVTIDPEVQEAAHTIMMATNPTGIVGALKGMAARPDSTPILEDIQVPTLLLTGDKDILIPPARSEAMAAAIPGSTLVMVEDAGHLLMMEQPMATTEAIRQFLESCIQ